LQGTRNCRRRLQAAITSARLALLCLFELSMLNAAPQPKMRLHLGI
jgi:hypothetical protein